MTQTSSPPEESEIKSLLDELARIRDAELARRRSLGGTEEALREAAERPDASPQILDLQARIFARQGRLKEAEQYWERATRSDPDNPPYRKGPERVEEIRQRRSWSAVLWPATILICGIAFAVCLLMLWSSFRRQSAEWAPMIEAANKVAAENKKSIADLGSQMDSVRSGQVTLSSQQAEVSRKVDEWQPMLERLRQSNDDISKKVASLDRAVAESGGLFQTMNMNTSNALMEQLQKLAAAQPVSPTPTSMPRVHAPNIVASSVPTQATQPPATSPGPDASTFPVMFLYGTHHKMDGSTLVIAFDEGLFDRGTHFVRGAQDRVYAAILTLSFLNSLSNTNLELDVVGCAESVPDAFEPLDSYTLGLKRAAVVTELIGQFGLLQNIPVRAMSSGASDLPFSGVSFEDHACNRTVTLRVFHRAQKNESFDAALK